MDDDNVIFGRVTNGEDFGNFLSSPSTMKHIPVFLDCVLLTLKKMNA